MGEKEGVKGVWGDGGSEGEGRVLTKFLKGKTTRVLRHYHSVCHVMTFRDNSTP